MSLLLKKYRSLPIQLKASFWFLVCTVIQRSISIITTPIFTRLLPTSEYGQYNVFLSWMGIITCFVTMYIYSGIYPQAIVKYDTEKAKYSSSMQALTLVLVIIWTVIYSLFVSSWNKLFSLTTPQMIAMVVVMWTHAIIGFWAAEQRVDFKYKKLVLVTLIEAIVQPILCVVFIHSFSIKSTGLVWGIAVATLVCYFPLFLSQMIRGKVFFSKHIWTYTLKLAIPLIPHYVSSVVLNNSDRIMIQKLVGEDAAGIYGLAYTISICGTLFNQALLQTIQPWIYRKIKAKQFKDIKKIAYPALIGIACINLLVILLTPEIIRIFAPVVYFEAIWVMPPISMSVFFMFMYNLFSTFEFYYEKTTYVSIATLVGAGLNVFLNYVFIQKFGYFAAGYTTLVCYIVFAVAHYLFMKKICREEINNLKVYSIRTIFALSATFIIFGFGLMATFYNNYVRYGIVIAVVVLCILYRKKLISLLKQFLNRRNNSEG